MSKMTYIEKQNRAFYRAMDALQKADAAEDKKLRAKLEAEENRTGTKAVKERYYVWSNKTD